MIARHRLAADGTGTVIAEHTHITALEHAALGAFTDAAPHRSKRRIPPGPDARAAAAVLRGEPDDTTGVVIDLARYERAANGRNTLT